MERSDISSQSQLRICQALCRVSPTILDSGKGHFHLSIYTGERTKKGISEVSARIMKAFPGWSREQTEILMDRFAENGFTDQRMMDAANHVIDTYEGYGRVPNIANFIQFDKQYRLFTIQQKNAAVHRGEYQEQDFAIVRIEGVSACRSAAGKRPLFALKTEIERYGLTTREPLYPGQQWPD
jgi:hypothetical protein